jgi:hypothetical protein
MTTADAPAERREAWLGFVRRAADRDEVEDPERWVASRLQTGVAEARVKAFGVVEQRLAGARAETAQLNEAEALRLLLQAARTAEDHADVPGAAAWIAEVHSAIAITAAQAGLPAVAESALVRAATLDPERRLRAGEAAPELVARAAEIARSVSSGPIGTFRVESVPAGARVFLDDEEVGATPIDLRGPIGTHVLRVEAAGHHPFGRVLDLLEGQRDPYTVELSPLPALVAARQLTAAVAASDVPAVPGALHDLREAGLSLEAWLVVVGNGEQDRALALRCSSDGCGRPDRLDGGATLPRAGPLLAPALLARELALARGWLTEPVPVTIPEPPRPWWRRWWVWTLIGVGVIAGATTTGVLVQPEPDQRVRFDVDFDPADVEP